MDAQEPTTPLARWMKLYSQSDADLSERVGVSRVQISRLRRDVCKASPDTARKLAEVTGLPPATFIYGDAA